MTDDERTALLALLEIFEWSGEREGVGGPDAVCPVCGEYKYGRGGGVHNRRCRLNACIEAFRASVDRSLLDNPE